MYVYFFLLQGTSVLSPLFPIAVMLYMAYHTARMSSTNLFQKHPCLFVMAFGMACSKITIKLVVCKNYAIIVVVIGCGGAVASWLVCSSPERAFQVQALAGDTVLCSWARHLTLTVPLSTQEYKWVPVNCWGNLTIQ